MHYTRLGQAALHFTVHVINPNRLIKGQGWVALNQHTVRTSGNQRYENNERMLFNLSFLEKGTSKGVHRLDTGPHVLKRLM